MKVTLLLNLQVTVKTALRPVGVVGMASMKSNVMVWNSSDGDSIGWSDP